MILLIQLNNQEVHNCVHVHVYLYCIVKMIGLHERLFLLGRALAAYSSYCVYVSVVPISLQPQVSTENLHGTCSLIKL